MNKWLPCLTTENTQFLIRFSYLVKKSTGLRWIRTHDGQTDALSTALRRLLLVYTKFKTLERKVITLKEKKGDRDNLL